MKYWLIAAWCLIAVSNVAACDACGCGTGAMAWGIMPNNNQHFIGVRSKWRTFDTKAHLIEGVLSGNSRDQFVRSEIVGRFSFKQRFQLQYSLPYTFASNIETTQQGIGDVAVSGNAFLLLPDEYKEWKHALQIGIGMEAPTGRFQFSHELPSIMQPGSGTWDYTLYGAYTVRYRDIGLAFEGGRKHNGTTKAFFRPGISRNLQGKLFYTYRKNDNRVIPGVGIAYESWDRDMQDTRYNIFMAYSGGELATAQFSLDYFTPHWAAGVEYGKAIYQDIAQGNSALKNNVQLKLLYFFQINKKHISNEK